MSNNFIDIISLNENDQEMFRKLAENFLKKQSNKSSFATGVEGEEFIKNVLENAECFDISDVRRESHKGDFVINKKDDIKVMVEVKNYGNTVPK